jgi:hypothetical protein
MSSNGEISKFSFRRCILAITILCTSIWWASDTHAQEAALGPSKMTARSNMWSLEGSRSSMLPNLAVGIAGRGDAPSYGSLRFARDEAANFARNTTAPPVGPVVYANRAEKGEPGPLVLSSLFAPTAGVHGLTNLQAEGTIGRQAVRGSPGEARVKGYSLLDDWPALGSFTYGYRMKQFLSTQGLASSESFTHEAEHYPVPLLQLKFGDWQLPVVLSNR